MYLSFEHLNFKIYITIYCFNNITEYFAFVPLILFSQHFYYENFQAYNLVEKISKHPMYLLPRPYHNILLYLLCYVPSHLPISLSLSPCLKPYLVYFKVNCSPQHNSSKILKHVYYYHIPFFKSQFLIDWYKIFSFVKCSSRAKDFDFLFLLCF